MSVVNRSGLRYSSRLGLGPHPPPPKHEIPGNPKSPEIPKDLRIAKNARGPKSPKSPKSPKTLKKTLKTSKILETPKSPRVSKKSPKGSKIPKSPGVVPPNVRSWALAVAAAEQKESDLDQNFRFLRTSLAAMENHLDELWNAVKSVPGAVKDTVSSMLDRQTRGLGKELDKAKKERDTAAQAKIRQEYRDEIEKLLREKTELEQLLAAESEKLRAAREEVAQARRALDDDYSAVMFNGRRSVKSIDGKKRVDAIRTLFDTLRKSLFAFASSEAINVGRRPNMRFEEDEAPLTNEAQAFHDRSVWNSLTEKQRMFRVMGKMFQILFRRILRPGYHTFGLEGFLGIQKDGPILAPEWQLRNLEAELRKRNVDENRIDDWVSTTILNVSGPLNNENKATEVVVPTVAREIREFLSPILQFTITFDKDMVHRNIARLCERAFGLKLAMRKAGGRWKIEVPATNPDEWGGSLDAATNELSATDWMASHEFEVADMEGKGKKVEIASIPFGALTKLDAEQTENGSVVWHKIIMENAWVTLRGEKPRRRGAAALWHNGVETLKEL